MPTRHAMSLEFFVFLPQQGHSPDEIVRRARAAEEAGFRGLAVVDHLAPPDLPGAPMYEAMVTASWIAAHTTRLRIGTLVLCDPIRLPALVAQQAVSIDHMSGGRFELGIGLGGVPQELTAFGISNDPPPVRARRLAESLTVIKALWTGAPVDFAGEFFRLEGAVLQPTPLGDIPIVIGGAGPRALELVRTHADWWNCTASHGVEKLESYASRIGRARIAVQQVTAFIHDESIRQAVTDDVLQRYGWLGEDRLVVGDAPTLIRHYRALRSRGVERCYVWFSDFADPTTITEFGRQVIGEIAGSEDASRDTETGVEPCRS
jgi:alkanesulfonate monooxygenase SsuD/methylene tetrahydromethanopterin reductase-like flavin-dependent oxidoreductase (luciferase family)